VSEDYPYRINNEEYPRWKAEDAIAHSQLVKENAELKASNRRLRREALAFLVVSCIAILIAVAIFSRVPNTEAMGPVVSSMAITISPGTWLFVFIAVIVLLVMILLALVKHKKVVNDASTS
jgi:hypothetical protein